VQAFIGKRVKIVYDDGNRVVTKFGVLQNSDANFLSFKSEIGSEIVPIARIIRLEVLEK